jgi:hypothetical protein
MYVSTKINILRSNLNEYRDMKNSQLVNRSKQLEKKTDAMVLKELTDKKIVEHFKPKVTETIVEPVVENNNHLKGNRIN